MKLKFAIGIISCTLLTILAPGILTAQTRSDDNIPMGTERRPLECPSRANPKKGAPSVTQVKMYLTCDWEYSASSVGASTSMTLMDDISVQVAPISRRFLDTDLLLIRDGKGTYLNIAIKKPIYDIRGSFSQYICSNGYFKKVGENCSVVRMSGSNGICFLDNFNDWHCNLRGGSRKEIGDRLPPPEK